MEKKKKIEKVDNENDLLRPDPETLNTTDPQEHMKGPISSAMHKISEEAKKNDDITKDEADRKRMEHM